MSIQAEGKETVMRLPKEIGEKIRDILEPDAAWEVIWLGGSVLRYFASCRSR